ncbi:MAG: hypothetical protein QUS66_10095 [Bacteroidota bacterium]|nr:hypothetical protein [Bacteroidota bacterium]
MKTGFKWAFLSMTVLMALTSAFLVAVLTDLSMFRATPVLFTLTLSGIVVGSGLMIRNRFYLPVLRNLRLRGKLLLAPAILLSLTVPAAIINIYYDLTGRESLLLLSGFVTSFASAFYFSTMAVVTLPAMASALYLEERAGVSALAVKATDLTRHTLVTSSLLAVLIVIVTLAFGVRISYMVFVFPPAAIMMMISGIIILAHFRNLLTAMVRKPVTQDACDPGRQKHEGRDDGFRSVMLVPDHYLDLISGRVDYLTGHAGDTYAAEIISLASRTFDPALLPAMRIIASDIRFTDKVREDAAAGISVIGKYYSDPVRNSDLLRLPGIHEKAAVSRAIMLGRSKPQEQDIVKLLGDASPEVRRTGLMAAGRYGMTMMRNEVLKALDNTDTAREAFYVLREFGPEVYGDIIGTAIRQGNSERENYIILRLLETMPLMEALPWLSNFIVGGHMGVRLKAASILCARGWSPQGKHRQRIEETLTETIHVVARLIAMQTEAARNRYFLLSAAIERERKMNCELICCLLSLLSGRAASEIMLPLSGDDSPSQAGLASEAIDSMIDDPLRRPLRALLGNSSDSYRLAELSIYFPVRSVKGRAIASFLLASEQNITGIWSKACALHLTATERHGLDREHAVSYLFSNSPILQEESARAIRAVNPGWYRDAESRLPAQARARISAVIAGTAPEAAMIFEKTRFLSLCFNNIPEEKMIMLASRMRYSESYDAGSLPGVISWVVPSRNGKTGLYSLPLADIAAFVFYYSEFEDIFVNYMDNQEGVPAT